MPEAGRLGDQSNIPSDSHGCPACPHDASGPAISGSPDVIVDGLPALRMGDHGIHTACCGSNTWQAAAGAPCVIINGRRAHRKGDATMHCGGSGALVEGSPTVFFGDFTKDGKEFKAKFEMQILYEDGQPLPNEPFELLDDTGAVVHAGKLDDNGWLRVPEAEWKLYTVRLKNGWILKNR